MEVHHIGYLTDDLDKAKARFVSLGFSPEDGRKHDEKRGIDVQFLADGAYRVELVEPCGAGSPIYPLLKRYKNTPYHICYKTTELTSQVDRLVKSGYMLIQKPLPCPCIEGGVNACFLLHPEIGIVELAEFAAP